MLVVVLVDPLVVVVQEVPLWGMVLAGVPVLLVVLEQVVLEQALWANAWLWCSPGTLPQCPWPTGTPGSTECSWKTNWTPGESLARRTGNRPSRTCWKLWRGKLWQG